MEYTRRNILFVLFASVAIGALLLCGAWFLEEYSKRVTTVIVQNKDGNDLFVVDLGEEEEGVDLIVQCGEDHMQDPFGRFAKFLQIDSIPLTVPGGPFLVARADRELPSELRGAQRAAIEILKRHSPRRVILIGHSECVYYDAISAYYDQLKDSKSWGKEDLLGAQRVVKTWFPKATVEIYFAEKQGHLLKFNPVDEFRVTIEGIPEEIPISSESHTKKGE